MKRSAAHNRNKKKNKNLKETRHSGAIVFLLWAIIAFFA